MTPLNPRNINIQPLKKALTSLERAIQQPLNEFNRDSVIQRFEFTFELCWKAMQKILEADRPLEDLSVKGILREAAKKNLISNLELWFKFQESRNLTSHTYNEITAEEVYKTAVQLPNEAHYVLTQLEKKIKGI